LRKLRKVTSRRKVAEVSPRNVNAMEIDQQVNEDHAMEIDQQVNEDHAMEIDQQVNEDRAMEIDQQVNEDRAMEIDQQVNEDRAMEIDQQANEDHAMEIDQQVSEDRAMAVIDVHNRWDRSWHCLTATTTACWSQKKSIRRLSCCVAWIATETAA
jgi:hypothetical protein